MMKTEKSVIIIGTNTAALRAGRLLGSDGVRSKVIRRTSSGSGCVYGVEIDSIDLNTAIYIFRRNNIQFALI